MKKTIALIAAIVVAALSICTLTICAFADETTTAAETTTVAAETTTEAAETTTNVDLNDPRQTTAAQITETKPVGDLDKTAVATDVVTETRPDSGVVTNPSGVTSIDDGDATTKTPAVVDDDIPSTGSKVVVPAIALLALAGSVAVAVKSKKD